MTDEQVDQAIRLFEQPTQQQCGDDTSGHPEDAAYLLYAALNGVV